MGSPSNPLVAVAGAWLIGLLCAGAMPAGPWQAVAALVAMAVAVVIAAWGLLTHPEHAMRTGRAPAVLLWLIALTAGLSVGPRPPPRAPVPSGMARLEAVVEDCQPGPDERARSVLRVLHGARLEDDAPIAPETYLAAAPIALPKGAHVRVLAKLAPRAPFRNPTPHPRAPPRFALQGEAWIASSAAVLVLDAPRVLALLDAARTRVRERLIATLPPRAASVARALVLGDGDAVDAEDQADIRGAGLLHVLAVSGLHVAILAGLLVALIQRALSFCRPLAARFEVRRIACALGVPAALLYAEFAGGAPSAWRAAVTAALSWTLVAIGRRPDPSATTAMAAIVLGAIDPTEVARPAFLLSIVATAAILSGPPLLTHDLRSWLRAAFVLSARTTLATSPIVLWFFGSVPLAGLVANVVLLPLASLLLVQLSAGHALLCTLTPFSSATAAMFTVVSDAFLAACHVFARLVPSMVWPPPDLWQGLVLVAATWALLMKSGSSARIAVVATAVICMGLLELRLRHAEQPLGRLRVTFLDVGQGDAALVDLPDGRAMLIDAGGNPGGGPDPGRVVILPLLQARRRGRIDIAVLTHPHPDHYGGLAALLGQIPVGELWDSGQAEEEVDLQAPSAAASQLLAQARAHGTTVREPAVLCGRGLDAGGARVRVLAPCPRYDSGYDANDNSLVLRIDYGHRSLLFAGDIEQHAETVLFEHRATLHADVLKVAHHGSRTSTSAPFLAAVAPKLAIISSGTGNRFGHPHAETLARLKAIPHVLSLSEVGGTIVETDGKGMQVRAWSGERLWL